MLIDDYVAELGRAIVGPAGLKRDMVVEARDGLVDAAEALQAEGVPREEAERLAVAGFGAVEEVAPDYQEELTAAAGRRLGLLLMVVGPLTWLMWWSVWRMFPGDVTAWEQRPEWYGLLSRAVDALQLFTGAVGGAMLLALGRGGWIARKSRLVTRAAAIYVRVLLPLTLLLCLPLMSGAEPMEGQDEYAPWMGAAMASLALMGLQLWHAGRCLRLTRLRVD